MSPEGWNESGLDGPEPAPVVDRDVLSLQRMSLRDGEGWGGGRPSADSAQVLK